MISGRVKLENRERFLKDHTISPNKIDKAIGRVTDKLKKNITNFGDKFPETFSNKYRYELGENNNWICGMYTGLYWLAYELTGDKQFRTFAESHLKSYAERLETKRCLKDHDVGFVYTPSCVAQYKLTRNETARETAIGAAEHLYNFCYTKEGGFILRIGHWRDRPDGCRTMMDTLMNAPLLFWAGKETGNGELFRAAESQIDITKKYLVRDDGSTFHHYQFEVGTYKPLHGLTFQGYSDDSCWSRGHSWGIYGFPIAYSYTGDKSLIDLGVDLSYYMLNHLPDDLIPYWDYHFTSGDEPRDSAAGAIAVCGLEELLKSFPEDSDDFRIFKSASSQMLEAIIDKCTDEPEGGSDAILYHVTAALPQGLGIDECAIYGDYFYLESLLRYKKPGWKMYW